MVATVEDARAVVASGVDVVVAQGSEAGGHRSTWVKRPSPDAASVGTHGARSPDRRRGAGARRGVGRHRRRARAGRRAGPRGGGHPARDAVRRDAGIHGAGVLEEVAPRAGGRRHDDHRRVLGAVAAHAAQHATPPSTRRRARRSCRRSSRRAPLRTSSRRRGGVRRGSTSRCWPGRRWGSSATSRAPARWSRRSSARRGWSSRGFRGGSGRRDPWGLGAVPHRLPGQRRRAGPRDRGRPAARLVLRRLALHVDQHHRRGPGRHLARELPGWRSRSTGSGRIPSGVRRGRPGRRHAPRTPWRSGCGARIRSS